MCQQAMLTRAIDGCAVYGVAVMTITTLLTVLTILAMCTVPRLKATIIL